MKRILFFLGTMEAGGAERVVSLLANHFVQKDYSVQILQYFPSECHYDLNPKVVRNVLPEITSKKSYVSKLFFLRKYVKENADVLISFMTSFNIISLLAMFGSKVPIIISERSDPRYTPKSLIRKILRTLLYPLSTKLICQTELCKSYFRKHIQKKCRVIFNPVDIGDSVGIALRTEKRNEIVTVGRLIPVKNHRLLLTAFSRFHLKHPDYVLRIFGQGDMFNELQEYCNQLGIADSVIFEGVVQNVAEHIACAKMFVLSSNYEGMPNSLIEAMCFGLPVISTKVAGATDIVNDENGILIDVGNDEQLSEAMELLATDSQKCLQLAMKATEIAELLKIDNILPQWEDIANNVLFK